MPILDVYLLENAVGAQPVRDFGYFGSPRSPNRPEDVLKFGQALQPSL